MKYFSYDDQIKPFEPLNKNNVTNKSQSSLSRINRYGHNYGYDNNHEREFSKSKSLIHLSAPNQYRFRMNTRYV